jgi:hypothetical protein
MNKTAKAGSGGKKAEAPPKPGFLSLPEFSPADVNDLLAANRNVVDEMMKMNKEIGEFVSKRMSADVEAMTRLTRCRDWPQVLEIQVEFMTKLANDYFAEANRLMERAAKMAASGTAPAGRKAKKEEE